MKKKNLIKIIAVTAVSCMAMGIMTACDESRTPNSSVKLITLDAPTNVKADFWDLTWDSVENSSGYIVRARKGRALRENYEIIFDGKETEEMAFDLYPYLDPDELFTVEVKAKGDGETYEDSEWAYVEYETEETSSSVLYELTTDESGYMAKGSADFDGELVFRDTYDGLPVVSVSGLKGSAVERARLPLSMTKLESEAFRNCVNLTEIKLPSTLLFMGSAAFKGCTNLETITAMEGFDYENCVLNGGIDIIISITEETSENVGVFEETKWLSLQGDKKFICWDKILYQYNGLKDGEVRLDELPDGIVNVAGGIFSRCNELTKVTVPKSWGAVGYKMFEGCSNLTEASLEDGITEVREGAFFGNGSLQKVYVSKDVKKIDDEAFSGCTKLFEINLPEGLTTLGKDSFKRCKSLKSITLPSTLRGSLNAFVDSGTIFETSGGIEQITVPEGITLVRFYNCDSLTHVELPNSLETIDRQAFMNCLNLKSLDIPNNVKVIEWMAFENCGIEELVLPKSLEKIVGNLGSEPHPTLPYIKKAYYKGTKSEFLEKVAYSEGKYLPIYFYSVSEPAKKEDGTYNGRYWRYVAGKPTAWA